MLNLIEPEEPLSLKLLLDALNGEASIPELLGPQWPGNDIDRSELEELVVEYCRGTICDEISRVMIWCARIWIKSGIDSDGTERVKERSLPPPLKKMLSEWLDRNQPTAFISSAGRAVVDVDLRYAREALSAFADRRRPAARIPLGDYYLSAEDRRKSIDFSPQGAGADKACLYFVKLLEHPERNRVALCGNPQCQRFFLRKREPRKRINNRACCDRCAGFASAQRTIRVREGLRRRLVEEAATLLVREGSDSSRTSKSIAEQLNKKRRLDMRINPSWVTWNRASIDAKAAEIRDSVVGEKSSNNNGKIEPVPASDRR